MMREDVDDLPSFRLAVLSDLLPEDDLRPRFVHALVEGELAAAARIAARTRSGVSGMSTWRTPRCASASTTAFCTAGVEPTVADSPMPLAPSGLSGVGVSVCATRHDGSSDAAGNGYVAKFPVSGVPSSS